MSDPYEHGDVPSGVDFREPAQVEAWIATAEARRPWRTEVRARIADTLAPLPPPLAILELGPGPGWLAEVIVARCAVARYTLVDVSEAMLAHCRARLGAAPIEPVVADFTRPDWPASVRGPYDAIVSMQAVHELRHKRHMPRLYAQLRPLLRDGGRVVLCDHEPPDDTPRARALHATVDEQHRALADAGFVDVETRAIVHGLYVVVATAPV